MTMMTFKIFTLGIILFYTLQRLSELIISRINYKGQKHPFDRITLIFHLGWFVSILIHILFSISAIKHNEIFLILVLLTLGQIIRLCVQWQLHPHWHIGIFPHPEGHLRTNGLYARIRHPNYLVVILEIFLVPFAAGAYALGIILGGIHLFLMYKKIQLEEFYLCQKYLFYEDYRRSTKKLIPFLY